MSATLSIARRPFKVGTKVYLPGDVIDDPASVPFFATKRRDGKIAELTEHNLQELATYIQYRQGVDNAVEKLTNALADRKYKDPAYVEKVLKIADDKGVETDGKEIKDIVKEIKATKKG